MDSQIGDGISPVLGLSLKVREIGEGAQGPEVVPDIVDHPFFHFTLFMRALGVAGPGDNREGAEEVQESFVEADEGTDSFDDRVNILSVTSSFGVPLKKRKALRRQRWRVSCLWEWVNSR